MVAFREKCPHCGAAHNPLLHLSFRTEPELAGRFGDFDPVLHGDGVLHGESVMHEPSPNETVTFTYLCDNCGETYWIESEVDHRSAL